LGRSGTERQAEALVAGGAEQAHAVHRVYAALHTQLTLFAILISVSLPAIGYADCLDVGLIAPGSARGLPAAVSAHERRTVESVVGERVEHVVCSEMVSEVGVHVDARVMSGAARGYLALTDQALLFVRGERTLLKARHRHDILLQAPFDEITGIVYANWYRGPDLAINVSVNREIAFIRVGRGKNGDALLEQFRRRVVAACGASAVLTGRDVACQ
jgi:hypothetical protein